MFGIPVAQNPVAVPNPFFTGPNVPNNFGNNPFFPLPNNFTVNPIIMSVSPGKIVKLPTYSVNEYGNVVEKTQYSTVELPMIQLSLPSGYVWEHGMSIVDFREIGMRNGVKEYAVQFEKHGNLFKVPDAILPNIVFSYGKMINIVPLLNGLKSLDLQDTVRKIQAGTFGSLLNAIFTTRILSVDEFQTRGNSLFIKHNDKNGQPKWTRVTREMVVIRPDQTCWKLDQRGSITRLV